MAVALKTLLSSERLSLAGARFRAWWEGEAFDEAAARAALEAKAAEAATEGAEDALFDPPAYDMPARLKALEMLWGEGCIRPACEPAFDPASAGLAEDGVLAVLGPGSIGPLAAIAAKHPGRIEAFEWREESFGALQHGVAVQHFGERVTLTRIDIEALSLPPEAFDMLMSTDDFSYCSHTPHLAQQIMKALKSGGCAVLDTYVGLRIKELATAFATSFAEPQIRAHGDLLQVLADTGLALERDDDLTESALDGARGGFKRLSERLGQVGELDVFTARELAWEAEAWRVRMRLLGQKRLERRRLVARKTGALELSEPVQAGNTNEPAG